MDDIDSGETATQTFAVKFAAPHEAVVRVTLEYDTLRSAGGDKKVRQTKTMEHPLMIVVPLQTSLGLETLQGLL